MAIKLDSTQHSVVVLCTACHWRALATDRPAGWTAGALHERHAHDGQGNAATAAYAAQRRAGGTG